MFRKKTSAVKTYDYCDSPAGAHRIVVDLVGNNRRVLDVGCGSGYLAREFRERGCTVVGIEQDAESAEYAGRICDEVLAGDVEEIFDELKRPLEPFDVIVCADVLEHLRYPDEFLHKIKPYLKPGGRIVASLPNIARIDIRFKLLFGGFAYQEAGILDKSHVRFFTLQSARELFIEEGYRVLSVRATGLAARLHLFKTLLGFQFIIEAEKP